MKTKLAIICVATGALGWILFFGSTFAIQTIDVTPSHGAKYRLTKFVPLWGDVTHYQMKEDGTFVMRLSYVYGLHHTDAEMIGGGCASSY